MKPDQVNRLIWRRFGIRKGDTLPYGTLRGTRDDLIRFFGDLGYTSGAEVGVARAHLSEFMLKTIPNLTLHSIDPWKEYYVKPQNKIDKSYNISVSKLSKYQNSRIVRKTSIEASHDFPDQCLDFIYIDGNHRFDWVVTDLIFWSRKVKIGGIVSGHDYFKFYRSGVMEAVNVYTQQHHIRPWYITREPYPSWFWVMDEDIYRDCCFG